MNDQSSQDNLNFDLPKNQSSVIKVIGVGGGGSNAVNHMFSQGIRGVDFVVCNTDSQALENSPVPNKIQLGVTLTEGLGAGANPEIGEEAAQESINDIKDLLSTNTKMVFITAGMGGGTGTGAAPVIAKAAKDMGILTVGIVTIPFAFEGNTRKQQAEKGVDSLRKSVDSLVVINNNKLREVYGNLGFKAGFAKADEVLATAARGIAEVITHHYTANIDLRDAKTVLANSGTAIMGAATSSGENRAAKAITGALDSPLLNDNHIRGAKNVLLLIVSGQEEITLDEIGEISDHIQNEAGGTANIIMGIGENEGLGDEIAVTIVATGFNPDQQQSTMGRPPQKKVFVLEEEQPVSTSVYSKPLQVEEEDEDELLNEELEKAAKAREEKKRNHQAMLFEMEEEEEEQSHPTANPVNEQPEPEPQTEDDEKQVFSLDDEALEQEEMAKHEAEEETDSKQAEDDLADEGPIFEIDQQEEATYLEYEQPAGEETKAEEPKEDLKPQKEEPKPEKEQVKRYTLEDYNELENRLKSAAPTDNKDEKPQDPEDETLKFEVKSKGEKGSGESKNRDINPMDSTIAESYKLRAEERRAKLKAFNYRFKNNPNGLSEANNEPAYKRHGVDISNEKYSSKSNQSRFTLDEGENGLDIKTNNSFLHDNVD